MTEKNQKSTSEEESKEEKEINEANTINLREDQEEKTEEQSTEEEPKTEEEIAKEQEKKKKKKWYIIGGCSGCFILVLIVFLILYFVVGTFRKTIDRTVSPEELTEEISKEIEEETKKAREEAEKAQEEAEKARKEAEEKLKEATGQLGASGQVGTTDSAGNFATKKTFASDVDNVSIEVTPINTESTDKITVELYDPTDNILAKETKTVGSSSTLNFVFLNEADMVSGKHEYKVLSGDEELDSGTFIVEAAEVEISEPTQPKSEPPSLDPVTFWHSDYFIWEDEWIKDWKTLDIDGDGYEEGLVLGQRGNQEEYHVYLLDWNPGTTTYDTAYEDNYQFKTTRIGIKDWNGDNQNDFVLVHTENSGDGTGIVYLEGNYESVPGN